MSTYKLTYFDIPARGETARLLFALAAQPFEDVRINKDDWPTLKSTFPFGLLPVLEVDGVTLFQSGAINRLLAKRFGYGGKDDIEQARVQMVADGMEDMVEMVRPMFREQDSDKRQSMEKETCRKVMDFLERLEKLLVANNGGDGFLIGNSLTLADLCFYVRMEFPSRVQLPITWETVPKLFNLRKRVAGQAAIREWQEANP